MDTVASAVFPLSGAASRQVCLAFRLTLGRVPCQTRPAIVCVIRCQPGAARPKPPVPSARLAGYSRGGRVAVTRGDRNRATADREPGGRRQL